MNRRAAAPDSAARPGAGRRRLSDLRVRGAPGGDVAYLPGEARPRTPLWLRLLPVALIVALVILQEVTPSRVELGFLLAATPPLAALAYGPVATALFGGAVLVLLTVPGLRWEHPGNADALTVLFVAVLSVIISWRRSRRDAQLVTVRSVAEAAQLAVLPPLTPQVGPVRCAALYRAAQRGTLLGGDLYDVRQGPYGVRALVADVQGHGLAAVGTVAALLGAFREAVLDEPGLEGVAARLDRRLVVDSAAAATDPAHHELFATAMLLEFPRDGSAVRVLSCGHPPPLLLRGGSVRELPVLPGAPLGLDLATYAAPPVLSLTLLPGDRLLVHTDGVTEARDASGTYYPLEQRLAKLPEAFGPDPVALTEAVWRDVSRFAEAIRDDVALLVLSRT
ncbi:PP2C family protein-serine/threonine phosphatase [Streptomyces sp. NPDC050418]|uniref:PP2C family protein-serine/threonine phosphatase n=1 Tax=Streptomyces sp. NPDC050418 TaxID=3365612 RepID=UPI0037B67DA5